MLRKQLIVGQTYAFRGWPESRNGRKALVLKETRPGSSVYIVRWPNGMESIGAGHKFCGPVEPAVPGVDERCLLCVGAKTIPVIVADPEKAWIQHVVGEEPCPNCAIRVVPQTPQAGPETFS